MPKFHVEVSWTVTGSATIEAEDIADAASKANEFGLTKFDNGQYLGDSFRVDNVEKVTETV